MKQKRNDIQRDEILFQRLITCDKNRIEYVQLDEHIGTLIILTFLIENYRNAAFNTNLIELNSCSLFYSDVELRVFFWWNHHTIRSRINFVVDTWMDMEVRSVKVSTRWEIINKANWNLKQAAKSDFCCSTLIPHVHLSNWMLLYYHLNNYYAIIISCVCTDQYRIFNFFFFLLTLTNWHIFLYIAAASGGSFTFI